jgi:hypothetical protein
MNPHLSEEDRDMLDMLHYVCWQCVDTSSAEMSWERASAYRDAKLALEEVLIELVQAKLKEKNT